jgi:tetratricopeptide (TPR) repeat protein
LAEVVLALALLAGITAGAFALRRRHPYLVAGWLWYLGMLVPMIGMIHAGTVARADRFTYLAQIGIYVAVTWLVAEWRLNRVVLRSLMAGVVAVLMVCACKQTAYWKDSETLWIHTLGCTTGNYRAYVNLAEVLREKGRMDEAIAHYQKALAIKPDYAAAHNNLGNALDQMGRVNEAIAHYQKALEIRPDYAGAHNNLGNALRQKGRVDEAIVHFQKALQINPDDVDAHVNLGDLLLRNGSADGAITQFQKALQIKPDDVKAQNGLGNAFLQKGNVKEAILHYEQAQQLEPANPAIQNNLAWLLATCPTASLRNGDKAVELARQANALTGGENPFILHTLAAALAEAGRFSEAVETARRALNLAEAQSKTSLAGALQAEMQLYQAGSPYHLPAQTH